MEGSATDALETDRSHSGESQLINFYQIWCSFSSSRHLQHCTKERRGIPFSSILPRSTLTSKLANCKVYWTPFPVSVWSNQPLSLKSRQTRQLWSMNWKYHSCNSTGGLQAWSLHLHLYRFWRHSRSILCGRVMMSQMVFIQEYKRTLHCESKDSLVSGVAAKKKPRPPAPN